MQSSNHQSAHDVCEALAEDWANLFIHYNCTTLLQPKLQCYTLFLARQLVAAISTEPIDRAAVRTVGAAVARLCDAKEETLGRTQELVAQHLLNGSDVETPALQPCLVPLLAELAVGFVQQVHVEHMLLPEALLADQMPTEDVQQANNWYSSMFLTTLPIVFFKVKRDGIITFSEGKGLQRLGISAENLVGRPVSQICETFFPQDVENIMHHLYRALDGEHLHSVGIAGHTVFDIQYKPIQNARGGITGVAGIALDITEQTRAVSELAELRSRFAESQEQRHSTHASILNVPLTACEYDVIRLVIAGQSGRLISQELGISQRTVASKLQAVVEKLGVKSRAEAIRRVVELGLIK